MIRFSRLSNLKAWAIFVAFSVAFSALTVMSVAHSPKGIDSNQIPFDNYGDQSDRDTLGSDGGGPSPTGTTVFPWPMQRHDELHTGFTIAPAPDTNAVLWNSPTGPYTYGSPAVAEGLVFIGAWTPSGDYMFAFYQENGTEAWRTPTFTRVAGNLGVTSSPAYSNGLVVFGGDRIYCLWSNNGTIKWTYSTGNGNWGDGSPTIADGKLFIGGADRKQYAFDLDTGTVLWTYQTLSTGGSNYGLYSAPAVYNGHLYVAACDGWVYQILIDQPGPIASVNHSYYTGYAMYGSPVIFDDKVYIGNGYTFTSTARRFYALNAVDLTLEWEFYPGRSTSFFGSAAIAYDKLFVGSIDGYLYALDPYGDGMGSTTVIWEYFIGSTWSSPSISSGIVYIGSQSFYVYAFYANQSGPPDFLWRYNTNGDVDSSPAISDGNVYIGSHGNGGMLYAFGSGSDIVSPFPLSVFPTGTGVPVNTDIVVDWSEGMNWGSVESSFSYTDGMSVWTSADGFFNHDPVLSTSAFIPTVDLDHSTTYWVTFAATATDTAGNPLDGDGNGAGGDDLFWSFTTFVDNPPTIDLWEPGGTPGQSYIVGTSVPVLWQASDDNAWPSGGNVVNISYNINPFGGNTISLMEFDDGIANWDTTLVPVGTYYVNITVYDSVGQLGGSYSNFSFDIVPVPDQPPVVSVINPVGGESWSAGTSIDIEWSMSDDYSSVQNLISFANYTSSSGSGTIAGPLSGLSSPATIPWSLPLIDATDVIVLVDVIDEAGNGGSDTSAQFEIDSTPPILDSHNPWVDETNVPTNANIDVEWREPMNATATEASFTLSDNATWTAVSGLFFWGGANLTSSFNPDADLLPNSWYTANFTTVAKDDSNPGNNMASLYSWSFRTAAVPDSTPPAISNIIAFPNPQEVFGSVSINASISDTYGISEALVLVFDPLSSLIGNFSLDYDIGNDTYYFERIYDILGIHTCTVVAQDNNGNWNAVSLGCGFSIVDTTPPVISSVTGVPDPVEIFNWTNVSAVVTDNVDVSIVRLYIWSMAVNYTMDLDGISGKYYNEHLCMMLGPHDYTIWAFDSSGNVGSYTGNFTTVDTELPQITHTPPGEADVGQSIDFQATVTDNHIVESVWLDFTDTSANHFLVEMSDLGGDLYQLTVPGQAQEGFIVYHIWASDESGNGATTQTLNVSVVNVTEPVDDTAPMPPYGLTAQEGSNGDSTVLDWEAPVLNEDMTTLDDLAGYHIYRSDTETGPKTRINPVLLETTGFVDQNVVIGDTYYYWVTAVDESGNESNYSVSADITLTSNQPDEAFDIVLLLLIIIIIAIVLLAIALLGWRKKRQDIDEESPVEETEEPSSEEGTELE